MSRIRSVHPGFFTDEAIASLPMAARVLLIGIWTEADDHGIFEWKPFLLKTRIFPAETFSLGEIEAMMVQIATANCIKKFEEDSSKTYGAIRNFCVFQRPREPSYRHPFPEWCRSYVGIDRRKGADLKEGYGSPAPGQEQPSGSPTAKSSHRRGEEKERREEDNSKINTESVERVSPASDEAKTLSQVSKPVLKGARSVGKGLGAVMGTPLPAEWVPSEELCEEVKATFAMTDADLQAEVPAFHAHNAQGGMLSQNWNATFRIWCKRWKQYRDKHAPAHVELNKPGSEPVNSRLWNPTDADWDGAVRLYAATGRWSAQFGPDPMSKNCRCPIPILRKYDISVETGEQPIPPRGCAREADA
jgi:hypothetical protein